MQEMRKEVASARSTSRAMSQMQARRLEQVMSVCRCSHDELLHHHRKSCTYSDPVTGKFCKCLEFHETNQIEGENEMTKKSKKTSSRKSNLLYFASEEKLESFDKGRLLDKKKKNYTAAIAQILAAKSEGVEFESLVAAVGKIVEHKNEKTLRLSVRWYLSSKRSDVAKFVTSKRVEGEARSAKANGAAKSKAPRKPRTKNSQSDGRAAAAMEATETAAA